MKRRLVTKLMMAAGVAAMAVTTIPASVLQLKMVDRLMELHIGVNRISLKQLQIPSQKKQKLMEIKQL